MIRILIADDHAILRRGLVELLADGLQGAVCGEAGTSEEVISQMRSHDWDLVILDISMPGRSGIDLLADLKRMRPKVPVLVLSTHPEDQYAKRVLKAQASGYLNKTSAPEELLRAIRKVLAGGRYVSETLAESLALDLNQDQDRPLHESLSNRELEVLRMLGSGQSVSEVAEELHLSVATVSTYRGRVLEKLNLRSTAQLMRYALKNNLVD